MLQITRRFNDPPTLKRKLALTKCERCRGDKQKCLPVNRIWPTKCDRCTRKGFPCSESKRVERRSKHTTADGHRRQDSEIVKDPNISSWRIELWMALVNYQPILNMALEQLNVLEVQMRAPFLNFWVRGNDFRETLLQSKYMDFEYFYEKLENTLAHLVVDLIAENTSNGATFNIVSSFIAQAAPMLGYGDCPMCSDTNQGLLRALSKEGNVCREFLLRLNRTTRHLQLENHQGEDVGLRLQTELSRISELRNEVDSVARFALHEVELLHFLPTCMQDSLVFLPGPITLQLLEHGRDKYDCLGRTNLQQVLDVIHQGATADICLSYRDSPSDFFNVADIMGRTSLHLACQKGSVDAVDCLLRLGADPSITTVYGSLPLHYAAASGSLDMCRKLLSSDHLNYNVNLLDCQGNTALFYAVHSMNVAVVKFLLTGYHRIDPNLGWKGKCPLPVVYAVYLDHVQMVQILLEGGALPLRVGTFLEGKDSRIVQMIHSYSDSETLF